MGGGGIPIVSDVVDVVGDVAGDIVGVVGDVAGDVVDVVSDAGSFIDDNVIQPALDDPIKTAATIGAVAVGGPAVAGALGTSAATGAAIAGGAVTAGNALASGADLEDALKAGAIGATAGAVGGTAAGAVGAETGSQVLANIAGNAAAGGTGAALSGNSIEQGLLTGGISGGISSGVNTAFNLLSNSNATNALGGQGTTMEDNIQYFDDGSSIQTFDDGSAIVTDYDGGTYVLDTDSGYAQAVNSATGQPIGEPTSGLFDTVLSGAKSVATSALKSLLLGNKPVTGNTAGQLATNNQRPATQNTGGLLGAGVNYALSANQIGQLQDAYAQNVAAQQAAVRQAQQQASFTPVGVTTAFGQSQFQVDPATGQLTSAGYTASPELAAQRERLFGLGASALPTTADTQAIQQQYISQQQGLLAPGREQQLAQLRNRQFQRGTTGLATGGTMAGYAPNAQGLMATNPEMAAYYNALAQQDATLAANAPTYAQNLLNQQIATGTGLFGAANTLEGYAQQPLTLAAGLGQMSSTAGAKAGQLGLLGSQSALQTGLTGQLSGIYGQGQALNTAVNPLVTAAQQGLSTAIGNWLS